MVSQQLEGKVQADNFISENPWSNSEVMSYTFFVIACFFQCSPVSSDYTKNKGVS